MIIRKLCQYVWEWVCVCVWHLLALILWAHIVYNKQILSEYGQQTGAVVSAIQESSWFKPAGSSLSVWGLHVPGTPSSSHIPKTC